MGTISCRVVCTNAQRLIQDLTGVRWPLDEILGWLNSGQRQVVILRPDAYSVTEDVQLVAGSRQAIPAGRLRLLDVVRNMGTSGNTPGRATTLVERAILDSQVPTWHSDNPSATVLHWIHDGREPRTYYVYPPQPTSGRGFVTIVCSQSPTDCTLIGVSGGTVDSVITLDDVYEGALTDWIVYRAMSKDATFANAGKAQAHYSAFMQALGLKTEADKRFDPRKNAPPSVNPNVPGNTGAFGEP